MGLVEDVVEWIDFLYVCFVEECFCVWEVLCVFDVVMVEVEDVFVEEDVMFIGEFV